MTDIELYKNNFDLAAGKDELEKIEKQLASSAPALHELSKEQIEKVARFALLTKYAETMKKDAEIIAADYQKQFNKFISIQKSEHTKKGYKRAFDCFAKYLLLTGIDNPLKTTPETADNFILWMETEKKAASTIRRNIAAISSFFSYIARYNENIRNPFKGTRLIPKRENKHLITNEIPANNLKLFKTEIKTITEAAPEPLKTMIVFMANRGLRAGAFSEMNIDGNRFYTKSKGKRIAGELPEICLDALNAAGLKKTLPFQGWTTGRISSAFQWIVTKLYNAGKIHYKYSPHDLRHYFALSEYTRTKDIYRLKELLNHANIGTTEIYLKGLQVNI